MATKLKVNGTNVIVSLEGDTPLLWALRDGLGLTGTRFGCGVAQCGACTVYVDGEPRRSCVVPLRAVSGKDVVTIEGLHGLEAEAIREAWQDLDVPQCGYCQSGQIMSAVALLKAIPSPDDDAIDRAMNGNICRCATYMRIRRAIKDAAEKLGNA